MKKRYFILCGVCVIISLFFLIYQGTTYFMVLSKYFLGKEQYLQAYREACVAYGGSCEEVNGLVSLTIHYFDSVKGNFAYFICLLYTSPSPRDLSTSRMPSSA